MCESRPHGPQKSFSLTRKLEQGNRCPVLRKQYMSLCHILSLDRKMARPWLEGL